MLLIPKSKIVTISILLVITISLFNIPPTINAQSLNLTEQQILTPNDQAKSLNLTQQENFTQPLDPTGYRCTLPSHLSADPIEMETNIISLNETWPIYRTDHRIYTTFECNSVILPPFNRDVVIQVGLIVNVSGEIHRLATIGGMHCNIMDIFGSGEKGNVTGCGGGNIQTVNQTITGCSELPIEHPVEFDSLLPRPENLASERSIYSQSHEYICHTSKADKLKLVTIFTATGFGRGLPMSVTCYIDVPTATFLGCKGKNIDRF